ncbi:MAG: OmpA family protein [Candidatus Hydrogenedentota bacterium]|nr:MAG: OmpA family protein [Candidatus Hydrogenedentota bacterium]
MILVVTLAILFMMTCANIAEWYRGMGTDGLTGTMLDKQQYELSEVAEVARPSEDEIVLRFHEEALFGVDEYSLTPAAEHHLRQVVGILGKYPECIVTVEGHTDNMGREIYNQWLSEKRSHTVADFLVEKGLDPDRIQVIGYGETRPIASNRSPEGRRRNRRVELHIIPEHP